MLKIAEDIWADVGDKGQVRLFRMSTGEWITLDKKSRKSTRKFLKDPKKFIEQKEQSDSSIGRSVARS